mgnify:FL=1
MKRTGIYVFLIVGVLLLGSGVSAAANALIGVIDLDVVMDQSEAGKLANGDLGNLIAGWQETLDSLEAAILELQEANPEAEELPGLVEDYQIAAAEAEYVIQQRAEELYQLLLQDIALVARMIGERDGYTIIAETASLFYYESHVDLTPEVIREYNRLLSEIE